MKRNYLKKFVSAILATIMTVSASALVLASEASVDEKEGVIDILSSIEPFKEEFGLKDLNFESLQIGKAIPVYNYIDGEFMESDGIKSVYPLISNEEVVALAMEYEEGGKAHFQISTSLAERIAEITDFHSDSAIVYDRIGCYLYSGEKFTMLKKSDIQNESRSVLKPESFESVTMAFLENGNNSYEIEDLGYIAGTDSKRSANRIYECDVDKIVKKGSNESNLCWAGSVACVVNYVKGKSYTISDIAEDYGGPGFNEGLSMSKYIKFMNRTYGLSYEYTAADEVLSDNIILKNIRNDFPLIGRFFVDAISVYLQHSVVIYGIDPNSSRIYIMNPDSGFHTADYSKSTYVYYTDDNYKCTWDRAAAYTLE